MGKPAAALAFVLLVASCAVGVEAPVGGPSAPAAGDDLFCGVWDDARRALVSSWSGEERPGDPDSEQRIEAKIARYDRIVPAGLRSDWDRARDVFDAISDLRFTVGYQDARIRPEHLRMVFGEAGPEPSVDEAEAAIAAIDTWALGACGTFCSRWRQLEEAVRLEPDLHPGELGRVRDNIERWETAIAAGDALVPDEVEGQWRSAASLQTRFLAMVRDHDFTFDASDEAQAEVFATSFGLTIDEARERSDEALDTVRGWVDANCEATAISVAGSGPGRLTVRLRPDPAIVHSWLLLAVLPAGEDWGAVTSIRDYVAGTCAPIGGFEEFGPQPGFPMDEAAAAIREGRDVASIASDLGLGLEEFLSAWELERFGIDTAALAAELESGMDLHEAAEGFGFDPMGAFNIPEPPDWAMQVARPIDPDTEYNDDVCQFQGEPGRDWAILEPGSYELFVGIFPGSPGDWRFFVAAPQACAQVPVEVAGDTIVDLPPLGPCAVLPVGNAQEVARRSPPAVTGDGSLGVRLRAPFEGRFGCVVRMVLLPAGATLNDVGRGDIWPSGGVEVHLRSEQDFDPEREVKPGVVPILAYPTTEGLRAVGPGDRPDGAWDGDLPAPVPLAAGRYDLRVERICLQQPDDHEDAAVTCAMMSVEVTRDTVIDLPDLGECR